MSVQSITNSNNVKVSLANHGWIAVTNVDDGKPVFLRAAAIDAVVTSDEGWSVIHMPGMPGPLAVIECPDDVLYAIATTRR